MGASKQKPVDPKIPVDAKLMWRAADLALVLSVSRSMLERRIEWGRHPDHPGDPHHGAIPWAGGRLIPVHRDEVGFTVAYAHEVRRAIGAAA